MVFVLSRRLGTNMTCRSVPCRGKKTGAGRRHPGSSPRGLGKAWTNAGRGPVAAKAGNEGFPDQRILPQKTNRYHNWRPKWVKQNPSVNWIFKDRFPTSQLKSMNKPKPWALSEEEYHRIKKETAKPPLGQRRQSCKAMMLQLREEEVAKMQQKYPREVADFKTGDRVVITKAITLDDDTKFEVMKGFVIARKRNSNESNFSILNNKLDCTWEMKVPLWSPFLRKVDILQKGNLKSAKAYYMRDRPVEEFQTK